MTTALAFKDIERLSKRLEKLMIDWVEEGRLDVPTIPTIIAEAMRLADDPEASIQEIQRLIEKDQSVAGRLMRLANSPMLRRSRDAKTIKEAIIRIGQHRLKNSLFELFVETKLFVSKEYADLVRALWRHSVATAILSREIAQRLAIDIDVAYLAGLVHDAGKAALLSTVIDVLEGKEALPEMILERALKDSHELAGANVVRQWNLNEEITDAVSNHHHPEKAEEAYRPLAMLLYAADRLVYHFGFGLDTQPHFEDMQNPLATYIPLFEEYKRLRERDLLADPNFIELGLNKWIYT